MKKRKKGSAIILVMVIGLAITIIMGSLTSAALYSSKLNIHEKTDEDLVYAAEGALEVGISKLRNYNVTSATQVPIASLKTGTIENVNYSITNISTNKYKVTGKATDSKNSRSVSAIMNKVTTTIPANPNLLDYALISKSDISILGPNKIDMPSTSTSVSAQGNITITGNNGSNKPKEFKNEFYLPNYKFAKVASVTIEPNNNGELVCSSAKRNISKDGNNLTNITSGIGTFMIGKYEVVIINATETYFNINGKSDFKDKIILCSGNITFNMKNTIKIDTSSIFGNKITVNDKGQFDMAGKPALSESEMLELQRVVSLYCNTPWSITGNNLSPNPDGGTVIVDWDKDEITYQ